MLLLVEVEILGVPVVVSGIVTGGTRSSGDMIGAM
jgi:hypothetical protein